MIILSCLRIHAKDNTYITPYLADSNFTIDCTSTSDLAQFNLHEILCTPCFLCSRSSSAWRMVERVTFSPRTSSSPGKRVPRSQEPPHGPIPLLGSWRTWFHSLPPSPIPVPAPNSPCWNPKAPECWWLPSPNSRWTTLGELNYGNGSLENQMITQCS